MKGKVSQYNTKVLAGRPAELSCSVGCGDGLNKFYSWPRLNKGRSKCLRCCREEIGAGRMQPAAIARSITGSEGRVCERWRAPARFRGEFTPGGESVNRGAAYRHCTLRRTEAKDGCNVSLFEPELIDEQANDALARGRADAARHAGRNFVRAIPHS